MELKCRICGQAVEVPVWSEEYERLKSSDDPAYICSACQEKIRFDAQKEQQ
ncbi:DUF2197 domain-containing protein [Sulfobacillus harzensis]|uniref:DUF2197 domain-containing protein n=1 Tax=Sulfobacillus harzensis TaxID=2729629 RepID=A0A7Y0L3C7_9FIRM|nr:DUF2197 domain-containing protein [Sulfobacillus harzensis]NMP22450.1 DUF2197 domain-containing protein [Sulfobacillus harzensis]